jgi:hypothetical protein
VFPLLTCPWHPRVVVFLRVEVSRKQLSKLILIDGRVAPLKTPRTPNLVEKRTIAFIGSRYRTDFMEMQTS